MVQGLVNNSLDYWSQLRQVEIVQQKVQGNKHEFLARILREEKLYPWIGDRGQVSF